MAGTPNTKRPRPAARRQSWLVRRSRIPLCRVSGTGGSNPPPPLQKARNGASEPGPGRRAFASLGSGRW